MVKRPNPVIGYVTAFAFVLASCAIEVEPTDLTPIKIETDRTIIERTLGEPDQVVTADGFTVAAYTYDKGHEPSPGVSLPGRGNLEGYGATEFYMMMLLLALVVAPVAYAERSAEIKAKQKGQLALLFDAEQKLLFAASIEGPEVNPATLEDLAAQYAKGRSGDADAYHKLSEIAFIPQQKTSLLEEAAIKGSAGAKFEIASHVIDDKKKATLFRKLAEDGYAPAQLRLAAMYRTGQGVSVDVEESKLWATKAADHGRTEELTQVGELYRFGKGTEKNIAEAIRLYERAAIAGDAKAQYVLGTLYQFGEEVQRDLVAAYMWYTISASTSHLAQLRKKYLADNLKPDQITEAKRLAREWLNAHPQ